MDIFSLSISEPFVAMAYSTICLHSSKPRYRRSSVLQEESPS